jgi:plastocyanin
MSSNLSLIPLFIFISFVGAQYLTEPPGTTAQPTSSATIPSVCGPSRTHTVSVGSRGSSFDPNVTFANPGDVVVFEFFPTNHSVIRTDFVGNNAQQNPCVPYELLHPGSTSRFSSGNKLVELDPNPNGSDVSRGSTTLLSF